MKISRYILGITFLVGVIGSSFAQTDVTNKEVYTGQADITATRQVTLGDGFRAVPGCNVHVYIDGGASYTAINHTTPSPGTMGTVTPSATGRNYVWTTVLRGATTSTSQINTKLRTETVAYFDGLGRQVQTIVVQGSPSKKDIVQAVSYDDYGRQDKSYLPYVSTSNTGAYVSNPEAACNSFYSAGLTGRAGDVTNPFNETVYEPSPLNRVTGSKGPDAWQAHPGTIAYSTNSSTTTGTIQHWTANKASFNFAAGQLYVTTYTDEDNKKTREYKDKQGRVVRKESYDSDNGAWRRTAYVYDDFGNLVIVVPPKASGPGDTELCYYYEYDERRRMIKKDLPGAAPVYLVYDKRDRLVMTQDGNMQANNQWMTTIYDSYNRPVITALININALPSIVKSVFSGGVINATFTGSGSNFGYTVSMPDSYSISETTIQTVTYYDNYGFTTIAEFGGNYNFLSYTETGFDASQSSKTKGMVTGTITRGLTDDPEIDNLLQAVTYYDDYGRPVKIISDNHMGAKDVVFTNYNFAGDVTATTTVHNYGQSKQVKLATTYAYDHQGRLLSEKLEINDNNEPVTVAANVYNELGELVSKYLHGDESGNDFNQQVDYSYNVKGWLKTQNDISSLGSDLFAQKLDYASGDNGFYNGNIWKNTWHSSGNIAKSYAYAYDGLNRLDNATYTDGTNNGAFNTDYGYDENGNIKLLTRYNGTKIDGLDYTYANSEMSNQLLSVTDNGTAEGYSATTSQYLYDANGNLRTDPSKGTTLFYNHLNLPEQVSFEANDNLYYTYDAAGNKLRKDVVGANADNNTRLDYIGSFIYENGDLKSIFTSEGRIIPISNGSEIVYNFEYNLKDHLGNTHVVFGGHTNGQPEIIQTTDYYPFGMVMTQSNSFADGVLTNRYLYNGKELQDDDLGGTKLDWYDYGARFYDPELARFTGVDPVADKFYSLSPYNYAANSPIRNVDLWGLQAVEYSIYLKYIELKARYSGPSNKIFNSSRRLLTGHEQTASIPKDVYIPQRDKDIINTVSKLKDVNAIADGTKEISRLVAEDSADGLQTVGTSLKAIGYGAALFTGGASLSLVGIGETIDLIGGGIDISLDLADGEYGDAATKAGIEVAFGSTSKMINKEAFVKAWSSGEEAIMKFLNELFYQGMSGTRDAASKKLKEKDEEEDNE